MVHKISFLWYVKVGKGGIKIFKLVCYLYFDLLKHPHYDGRNEVLLYSRDLVCQITCHDIRGLIKSKCIARFL